MCASPARLHVSDDTAVGACCENLRVASLACALGICLIREFCQSEAFLMYNQIFLFVIRREWIKQDQPILSPII